MEAATLRRRIQDAEGARERAKILVERLAANSCADTEGQWTLEAARAAVRLEEESRRAEELQEASRRAVTSYVRSSRMGARVDYYHRHALELATLETDRVPLPTPYVCPSVGTIAGDGGDHLEAWDVTEPGLVKLAEMVSPDVTPGPSRLESPRKRKRADESGGGALG